MKRTFSFLLVVLALGLLPAFAQNLPPTWVYARDYNYNAIQSAQANTYTFNGPGACQYSPSGGSVNGYIPAIFDFSGFFPTAAGTGNGHITSGLAVLTDASALFTAGMVGDTVTVSNAGTSGTIFQSTILSYQSSTQVTLSSNAVTTTTTANIVVYTPVYYPVTIVDALSTNSEVVTPSSTTNGATTCGFSATTVNQHVSFQLQSGTAGLQEAILNQATAELTATSPNSVVMLDNSWYTLQTANASYTNGLLPAAAIASVKGSPYVELVDLTTAPFSFYSWNGTNYTPAAGNWATPTLTSQGQGAGGTPTAASIAGNGVTGVVAFTTGGTTPTAANIFLLTWAAVGVSGGTGGGGFAYAPNCTVTSIGTNNGGSPTVTSTAGPPATMSAATTSALPNTTAFKYQYVCR